MGLLDELGKGLLGNLTGGGGQSPLMDVITGLISNPNTGGLSGLVQTFAGKGLGDVIGSWISTGENQPISADQIQHVFGKDQLQGIAEKLGISSQEASGGLAQLLPQIIDKLTPEGSIPQGGLLEQGLGMLKGKLFGG
jgi:uncharacterized protein YidB (DUF937 family)